MSERTDWAGDDGGAEGDFLRGGANPTSAGFAPGVVGRFGGAPGWLLYTTTAVGALLALLVAWSTWASPGYGVAVAVLAGVVVFAASLVAVQLGWAAAA